MRLPPPSNSPEGTPHPIRHLKHILRNQIETNNKLTQKIEKENVLLFTTPLSNDTAKAVNYSITALPSLEVNGRSPVLNICYTTNEVLVIIAVTCFLNFAFILLIMSCVHFFSTRANRLKSALVSEAGDEYCYEDFEPNSDDELEWKTSLDKTFDRENKMDLLQYINNLP